MGFNPSLKHLFGLATLKRCDTTKQSAEIAEQLDTKSSVKLGVFRSQLEVSCNSSHTEELWYNQTVCLWMTIFIYIYIWYLNGGINVIFELSWLENKYLFKYKIYFYFLPMRLTLCGFITPIWKAVASEAIVSSIGNTYLQDTLG